MSSSSRPTPSSLASVVVRRQRHDDEVAPRRPALRIRLPEVVRVVPHPPVVEEQQTARLHRVLEHRPRLRARPLAVRPAGVHVRLPVARDVAPRRRQQPDVLETVLVHALGDDLPA
eukprot:30996-Pelagococcus_subviridis.AAC.14